MKKSPCIFLLALAFLPLVPETALARRFDRCECVSDYQPPKGVYRFWTRKVKTEWELRYHCLPCGGKAHYKVQVVTYRERYSNGVNHTWKCVVEGTETPLDGGAKGVRLTSK